MILVIDNFDSFTYNLVQYLGQLGAEVKVFRNNEVDLAEIDSICPAGILLSPGPCSPRESGVCRGISELALKGHYAKRDTAVFGVCLGHQTIGEMSGATVRRARTMMHGKSSLIDHDGNGLFKDLPNPMQAIRYHSLVVEESTLSSEFEVSARSLDDGEIQGLRHRKFPIEGVQFHPESVLTQCGIKIVENFLGMCRRDG